MGEDRDAQHVGWTRNGGCRQRTGNPCGDSPASVPTISNDEIHRFRPRVSNLQRYLGEFKCNYHGRSSHAGMRSHVSGYISMPTLVILATADTALADAWERQLPAGRMALRAGAQGFPGGTAPGFAAVVVLDATS